MARLEELRSKSFERRLRAQIQARLGDVGMSAPTPGIRGQIALGVRYARSCKLARECDTARFMEIVCTTVGDVEKVWVSKEALAILFDHRDRPEVKLERFAAWADRQAAVSEKQAKDTV